MGRPAQIEFTSLKQCLINLPLSIHAPLLDRSISPQSIVIELTFTPASSAQTGTGTKKSITNKVYVGWTGLPSQLVGMSSNQVRGGKGQLERIEIDPQFAQMIGLSEGLPVSLSLYFIQHSVYRVPLLTRSLDSINYVGND